VYPKGCNSAFASFTSSYGGSL